MKFLFKNKEEILKEKEAIRKVAVNPLYCTMCEYTVQFLDVELKKNSSEEAIEKALKTVCDLTPASVKAECNALVNNYGIYLIQLLIQLGDPLKVCQAIKLC